MSKASPFASLVPLLVDAIPPAVGTLKLTKPICSLRLYYYNTCAPYTYLDLRTVSEELRAKVLTDKGRNAPFYLWASGEECYDGGVALPPEQPAGKTQKQIAKLFEQVYELLSEDGHEDSNMEQFRQVILEVARQLNAKDWKPFCPVTDDFVVVAADGSQHFADDYDDLVKSIPPKRLALLRARGLLGPGETWDQLP